LELHTQNLAEFLPIALRVQAEHAHRTAVRNPQTADTLDGGRLTGAVRPEDPEDLPLIDIEGDVDHGGGVAVGLRKIPHLDR
jgi:hypothetical protein